MIVTIDTLFPGVDVQVRCGESESGASWGGIAEMLGEYEIEGVIVWDHTEFLEWRHEHGIDPGLTAAEIVESRADEVFDGVSSVRWEVDAP